VFGCRERGEFLATAESFHRSRDGNVSVQHAADRSSSPLCSILGRTNWWGRRRAGGRIDSRSRSESLLTLKGDQKAKIAVSESRTVSKQTHKSTLK
jgi:hypothetical protein